VHPADVQDRDGAMLALAQLAGRAPRLKRIWADGAYTGRLAQWALDVGGWSLELVRRPPRQRTFEVLPRRWVVERTFGWLGRHRRLSKDYEVLPETTRAWIYAAMTGVMLRRLAGSNLRRTRSRRGPATCSNDPPRGLGADRRRCVSVSAPGLLLHPVPDDVVQMITASGTPAEVKAKVREYVAAGATCPILYPLGADVRLMIDTFAAGYSSQTG